MEDRGTAGGAAADGPAGRRYWAFVSYSRADQAAAQRLHEFLETYRLPSKLVGRIPGTRTVPPRLAPVFRDRDELAGCPDLAAALERALSASDALVVLCSPAAARSAWVDREVETYKRMGRSSRIFAFVVADPEGDATLASGCFPPSLRLEYGPDGVPTGRGTEPLAADSRPGQDGWEDACLKLVAGIVDVPYDDLRRREEIRRRRGALARRARTVAVAAGCALVYVGLADAGLELPGADPIRIELDRHGWTLFRPIRSHRAAVEAAEAARRRLRARLVAAVDDGSLANDPALSTWMIGQFASALANDPDSGPAELDRALQALRRVFAPRDGDAALGLDSRGGSGAARAEHSFWIVIGLASVLGRQEVADPETRRWLADRLSDAQRVADDYRPLPDGGWNVVPHQNNPRAHYIYTTGLALHMLLAVRAAGAGWHGDRARLDELIGDTVAWLSRAFLVRPIYSGWRRSPSDDRPPDNGITLLIYAALGRVCTELDRPPSPAIQEAALAAQIALGSRAYDQADPDIYFDVQSRDEAGKPWPVATVTRMVWYPWAAESVVQWRRCAERQRLPPEILRRLDRALGHLVVDLSEEMLRDLATPERQLYVTAETYYGLGRVP